MKLFLLVLLALPALAWEADNSRSLSDVMYMPGAGRLYGDTLFEHTSEQGKIEVSGVDFDLERRSDLVSQQFGYGLTKNLQLIVSQDYTTSSRTQVEDNPSFKSNGASNPNFAAVWRVVEQATGTVNIDVLGGYSPDMIDSEENSTKGTSNASAGGSAFIVGARGGKKFKEIDMAAQLVLSILGDRESKDTTSGTKTSADGTSSVVISYTAQLPLSETLWLRGEVDMATQGEQKRKFSDGTTGKEESHSNISLGGGIVLAAIPDHLVLRFGVKLSGEGERKVKYSDGTVNKYKDFGGASVLAQALYQF